MQPCPCGSDQAYSKCCKPTITGKMRPLSAEALMRSRYTAYTQANIAYIRKTMKGQALLGFNPISAKNWAQNVTWLGLKVIRTEQGKPMDTYGLVEFKATYIENGQQQTIHEISEFKKTKGCWFYLSGKQSP